MSVEFEENSRAFLNFSSKIGFSIFIEKNQTIRTESSQVFASNIFVEEQHVYHGEK